MRILGVAALAIAMCFSSGAAVEAAPCVLGSAFGHREFSLPRNGVCVINRQAFMKLISVKITVRPKLGQFGSASISEWAYRAGNVAGNDYFEYISTESFNGSSPRDYRVRNVVHITP
jgi:hypothetical protein